MPQPPLPKELAQVALDQVTRYGGVSAAARAIGIPVNTMKSRRDIALRYGLTPSPEVVSEGEGAVRTTTPPPQAIAPLPATPEAGVDADRQRARQSVELKDLKAKYATVLKRLDAQAEIISAFDAIRPSAPPTPIVARRGDGESEATAVLVASDWHIEEEVGVEVGGLNAFNLDIAEVRAKEFFVNGLRLIKLLHQDVAISDVVLGLLGDFITNEIHGAENAELNQLPPTVAISTVQGWIIAGLEYWLANSPYTFTIVCKSGNHGRSTHTTRFSAEDGHSFEWLMYRHIETWFRNEPRLTFVIEHGIHSYLPIYDQTIRFHHGHAIKYGGGIGGITIPVNKAVQAWDIGRRASFDVFGHFHQYTIGSKFLCNGSLIGMNGYALSIKASPERPQQALFLVDKKRGRTCHWPILFSV